MPATPTPRAVPVGQQRHLQSRLHGGQVTRIASGDAKCVKEEGPRVPGDLAAVLLVYGRPPLGFACHRVRAKSDLPGRLYLLQPCAIFIRGDLGLTDA
jgi:hypothetical protein